MELDTAAGRAAIHPAMGPVTSAAECQTRYDEIFSVPVRRAVGRQQFAELFVNVDGAIAAICADLGFAYELGHAVFLISRLPGLIAHAHEERTRQKPMRAIDPSDHDYDGARQRRLPESRK